MNMSGQELSVTFSCSNLGHPEDLKIAPAVHPSDELKT